MITQKSARKAMVEKSGAEQQPVIEQAAIQQEAVKQQQAAPAPELPGTSVAPAAQQGRPDRSVSPHKKRVPLGVRNRLTFNNLDDRYYYRVINDRDDRIQRALDAGYEFVESDQRLGDAVAGDASPMGASVHKPVGGGTVGYLMRQPMEYHEEDQAAKLSHIDEIEAATKPKAEKGQYGEGLVKG